MFPIQRWRISVRGIVQGVGFRPFVYRLAHEARLTGNVRNTSSGVEIELQGETAALDAFCVKLREQPPRLARIESLSHRTLPSLDGEKEFSILSSEEDGASATIVSPDTGICEDCLRELFTPTDRRYRYAFINCTHCGARYTLTRGVPYDRSQTSMASFKMCDRCAAEYANPLDRRFHAEPNACPECGPRLSFFDKRFQETPGDPVANVVAALERGDIAAIKGYGGFHLACDATNQNSIKALRQRKARDAKPFAVMALNLKSVERYCEISDDEKLRLISRERPIVLLKKRAGFDEAFPELAPGMNTLGVMLPYAPLHFILFHEALKRPAGFTWLDDANAILWVMTSANPGGEPLVTGNDEAFERLNGIADCYLTHDRDIVGRCDDSVLRVRGNHLTSMVRRARGFVPLSLKLRSKKNFPPILATGAYLKNTICVTRGDEAFVSPHIGSLDNAATCRAFDEMVERLLDFLKVKPEIIVCDKHPDFYSSLAAAKLAETFDASLVAVAHHHAHIAAIAAEHGVQTPALGLAFDGVGLGDDGKAWGGEWLICENGRCERAAHLAPLPLPGGDRAAREPWRVASGALMALEDGSSESQLESRFERYPAFPAMLDLLRNAQKKKTKPFPATSSMGRYFDAAAAAAGICERMSYEGEAAMKCETAAHEYLKTHEALPSNPALVAFENGAMDLKPLIRELFDIEDPRYGAALFHGTLIAAVVDFTDKLAKRKKLRRIIFGGGCWMNALLSKGVETGLAARGYEVYQANQIPANDGGISLGQAAIAAEIF